MKQVFSTKNRNLLKEMIRTDFKLRYQGSILGYFWSFLKPLLLFGVLYLVFTRFLRFGDNVPNFAISLLLGIVLWTFFVETTSTSLTSIVSRGDLLRKINIPKYIPIISATSSALINLILNLFVVIVFTLIYGASITADILWLPLIILELYIFSVSMSFILAALYVRFRDVSYIWDVTLQLLFFATPIVYPLTIVPSEAVRGLLLLNPLAQIIQAARSVVTYSGTITTYDFFGMPVALVPIVIVLTTAVIAYFYFKSQSKTFTENV